MMKQLIPTLLVTLVVTMAPAQSPVLINTFTNPTPATGGYFGMGIAALGSDRILVSARNNAITATNDGAVYLFHTNGTLLTTFTNADPGTVQHNGTAKTLIVSPAAAGRFYRLAKWESCSPELKILSCRRLLPA